LGTNARFINLDAHWSPGEARYISWPHAYADILLAREPILVMELAGGEPPGLDRPGAVQGAREWLDVLNETRRVAFLFRLSCNWPEYMGRLRVRHQGNPQLLYAITAQAGFYALYQNHDPLVTINGLTPHTLDTTSRTPQDLADEVMRIAGL
jgi:hypothetical protein